MGKRKVRQVRQGFLLQIVTDSGSIYCGSIQLSIRKFYSLVFLTISELPTESDIKAQTDLK